MPLNDLNVGSVVRTLLETVALRAGADLPAPRARSTLGVPRDRRGPLARQGRGARRRAPAARRASGGHACDSPRRRRRAGRDHHPGRHRGDRRRRQPLPDAGRADARAGRADARGAGGGRERRRRRRGRGRARSTGSRCVIAGIDAVTNPQPARRARPAGDRRRAAPARAAARSTASPAARVDALRFGLLLDRRGEGRAASSRRPTASRRGRDRRRLRRPGRRREVQRAVALAIEELRPAGVRVIAGSGARVRVDVQVALTLAGTGVAGAELAALQQALGERAGARTCAPCRPAASCAARQLARDRAAGRAHRRRARSSCAPDGRAPSRDARRCSRARCSRSRADRLRAAADRDRRRGGRDGRRRSARCCPCTC